MKTFLLLLVIASSATVRADLVIRQMAVRASSTNEIIIRIHGDKMRYEQVTDQGSGNGGAIVISDVATLDSAMLMPRDKTVMKHPGAQIPGEIETMKQHYGATNAMFAPPTPPADTGKAEPVGGYDTEIYTWTGPNGMKQTLWVARDFPNYAAIKADRDKVDQWNLAGVGKGMTPDLRLLPGMVVKTQTEIQGRTIVVSLVSAKVEPVDPAVFEIPGDYADWKPPVHLSPMTTATNAVK